ncbi:MAG: Lrp/AsnC family transcriptional regulator [archaeon]|jgi:Lrp/AsnC family leucine-responsive transcriptional regulator
MQENAFPLDAKYHKLLSALDENARASNAEIGKKIGLSKETTKYRIDQLTESGVIKRFRTVINYFKLGIVKYKLYLKLTNTNKETLEKISKYFMQKTCTEWVSHTTGRWDFVVGFLVHNANEMDDELQEFLDNFSDSVLERSVTTTLYLAHMSRTQTKDGKQTNKYLLYSSKDPKIEIDSLDEQILRIIANNARMPTTQIAHLTKTTPRIVAYKLKSLEKKEIILGYKTHINLNKIGKLLCKVIISLKHANKKELNSFINITSALAGAVWPQRIIGAWDYEIDFEMNSYNEFQDRITSIKERFPELIKNTEFLIEHTEYKLDFYANAIKEM